MKILIIKADTNDADYVHNVTELGDNEEFVRKVAKAVKKVGKQTRCNWPTGECAESDYPMKEYKGLLTEDEVERFHDDFVPYGDHGIHTIDGIRILTVVNDEELI